MTPPRGKTKIVCTLGPASSSAGTLAELIASGMDIVRLNFSHGTHEEQGAVLACVREAVARAGASVSVLQDLQGPKIRIGELGVGSIELRKGETLVITTEQITGGPGRVSTTYAALPADVRAGSDILLDDGKMRLTVRRVAGTEVECEVVVGGRLSSHKGINLPGVAVSAPSLTGKDVADLEFGLAAGVDYVALSFVRTADDVRELREAIAGRRAAGDRPLIIAKIEKPQAVANIDEIIGAADGIMVARGDLGVELPTEDVPMLQKMIIARCNSAGKPVIVATQMLESMIESPRPTRAEASDVANAVLDGGDAVMLSGETSVGKYPVEAVRIMDRIIRKVESEMPARRRIIADAKPGVADRHDALGRSACMLATQMRAAAIVTVTNSGQTARVIARYRPDPPIIAITDSARTLRSLAVVWGVRGMVVENLGDDSDRSLARVQETLLAEGVVKRGEYVVLLAGQPFFARGGTNFIKVEKIG
ncbi:MAG TPA: pyruvate kinase [Bacteroidota bacterium]|nr:pyruvate kinase [Bacteroidota bacterium]